MSIFKLRFLITNQQSNPSSESVQRFGYALPTLENGVKSLRRDTDVSIVWTMDHNGTQEVHTNREICFESSKSNCELWNRGWEVMEITE